MYIHDSLDQAVFKATTVYQLYMDLGPDFPSQYAFEEYRLKMYRNNGS